MANYQYKLCITVQLAGNNKSYPKYYGSGSVLLCIATGTTTTNCQNAINGTNTSYSVFAITGIVGDNVVMITTTASTCYANVVVLRPGCSWTPIASATRLYEGSVNYLNATCTLNIENAYMPTYYASLISSVKGSPYYWKQSFPTLTSITESALLAKSANTSNFEYRSANTATVMTTTEMGKSCAAIGDTYFRRDSTWKTGAIEPASLYSMVSFYNYYSDLSLSFSNNTSFNNMYFEFEIYVKDDEGYEYVDATVDYAYTIPAYGQIYGNYLYPNYSGRLAQEIGVMVATDSGSFNYSVYLDLSDGTYLTFRGQTEYTVNYQTLNKDITIVQARIEVSS